MPAALSVNITALGHMDDYDYFQELALRNFSLESLVLFEAAARVIRARFPDFPLPSGLRGNDTLSFPSRECIEKSAQECCPVSEAEDEWVEYAGEQSRLLEPFEGGWALSTWSLCCGGETDDEVVTRYLKLLETTLGAKEIAQVREVHADMNEIVEGREGRAIIPFKLDTGWAFAVAYPDCVHWYDSQLDRSWPLLDAGESRPIVRGWDGPRQSKPNDSGVCMLLGIRLVLQGSPHLNQKLADQLSQTFRYRILIELLTETLDPRPEEFRQILSRDPRDSPAVSSHFNNAWYGSPIEYAPETSPAARTPPVSTMMQDTLVVQSPLTPLATPTRRRQLPTHSSTRSSRASTRRLSMARSPIARAPISRPSVARSISRAPSGRSPIIHSPVTRPPTAGPAIASSSPSSSSDCEDDDRRVILANLNKAVQFKRSTSASNSLDVEVLWSLARQNRFRSPLHRKYHAVLFYDKVSQLSVQEPNYQRMRRLQSKCRFWKSMSCLGERFGLGRYIILCALEASTPRDISRDGEKNAISEFERRFRTPTDPLLGYLREARDLCDRALEGEISEERLMIENYSKTSNLKLYEAFVSPDPRKKLGLPSVLETDLWLSEESSNDESSRST